jgi:polysaccharide biosynthesis protein PslH
MIQRIDDDPGIGGRPMRLLFVKQGLSWPRSSGHDVHCYHMMQSLGRLGHEVALLTVGPPRAEAVAGLDLSAMLWMQGAGAVSGEAVEASRVPRTRLQERFRSYWGIDESRINAVARAARDFDADAVVAVGLDVLPYLLGVSGSSRVWYAADEWAWHHLSLVRPGAPRSWGELKQAAVKGLYERAYAPLLDRIWVVSEADRRAMRLVAGRRPIDVIANGVDADHYRPADPAPSEVERSCVFWGRLDFGPNIQALEWFARKVWPMVRRQAPDATFTIYGFRPSAEVIALGGKDGIEIVPDLPDLREEIARHQVVVLPFVSGGGIKNKLLEAAGMGKAAICSSRAIGGLRVDGGLPFAAAGHPYEWVEALLSLWSNPEQRYRSGAEARRWVVDRHSWAAAADLAAEALGRTPVGSPR